MAPSDDALPLIKLLNATKVFGDGPTKVIALRSISASIARDEFVALTGPSGSGKSTFLNIIGGLDGLSSGSFEFAGVPVEAMADSERHRFRRDNIGFVFQGFNLIGRCSVLENVELPLLYRGLRRRVRRDLAFAALDTFGLVDRAHAMPAQLSGGQQQRVGMARAIVGEPKVLLADEPTGNLDTATTRLVMGQLHEMRGRYSLG